MFTTFSAFSPPIHSSRRANPRACDQCRRLKIKCRNLRNSPEIGRQISGGCDQCLRAGLQCTYIEMPARRGRPRKRDERSPRVRSLEQLLDLNCTRPSDALVAEYDNFESSVEPEHTVSPKHVPNGLLTDQGFFLYEEQISGDHLKETAFTDEMIGICIQAHPPQNFTICTETERDIWVDVNEFFDTLYMIFPIVSYRDLTSRLIMEPDWMAVPDLKTLLLAIRLLNGAGRYRMKAENKTDLCDLIHQVEMSRLCHEFADTATLDAIVCSLCLFAAYNVLEKHNRAFLYLDEAFSLFEMVSPLTGPEEHRRLRIEQVLFNTEAATQAIYAPRSRKLRARKPSVNLEQNLPVLVTDSEPDRIAAHLLKCLTQINLAQDADGLEKPGRGSEVDMEALLGAGLNQHRYSCIQAADVVVTRQWQLSSKLVARKTSGLATEEPPQSTIERLGTAVMSWICVLREGELRIVGLGKLTGLAQNICILTEPAKCQYILAGLTGAIMREDYERKFTRPLAEMITLMTSSLPPSIGTLDSYPHDMTENSVVLLEHATVEHGDSDLQFWISQSGSEAQFNSQIMGTDQRDDYNQEDTNWLVDML